MDHRRQVCGILQFHASHWTLTCLSEELSKPAERSNISKAYLAQPLCTAIQIALVNSLARCGVQPSAVVGHSSGEIAAAYAAGALSCSEALATAYYRGYVTTQQTLSGGMAAIGLGAGDVLDFLTDGVVIACENSPGSTTISGDLDQLRKVVSAVKEQRPDVLARELKVEMAYHSRKCQYPERTRFLLTCDCRRSYEEYPTALHYSPAQRTCRKGDETK